MATDEGVAKARLYGRFYHLLNFQPFASIDGGDMPFDENSAMRSRDG